MQNRFQQEPNACFELPPIGVLSDTIFDQWDDEAQGNARLTINPGTGVHHTYDRDDLSNNTGKVVGVTTRHTWLLVHWNVFDTHNFVDDHLGRPGQDDLYQTKHFSYTSSALPIEILTRIIGSTIPSCDPSMHETAPMVALHALRHFA